MEDTVDVAIPSAICALMVELELLIIEKTMSQLSRGDWTNEVFA
jgi:hypothetical protein